MCGINGLSGTRAKELARMNAAISHRGPDYAGAYMDDAVSLGHLLLSIRGTPDESRQPYTKPNSPWVLLFNGQLYNTKQMQSALPASYAGTTLDTALLFGLIEKYGWDFVSHIHGMYAIALYHKDEKEIRLYRDPTGQKLLYYYHKDGAFIFSSELKGIFANEGVDRTADPEALAIFTDLGYLPGAKTLFAHIRKLNPAEVIRYSCATGALDRSYADNLTDGYYAGDAEATFKELVAEHLQSKQRVALNLSGGLDSSILLHEMKGAGHDLYTYTTAFEGSDELYNRDAVLARKLAKDYGATHHEILVTKKSYLEHFAEAYECVEEPVYNINIPTYLQTAKAEGIHGDRTRVILSGNGGDELFCGYPYYERSAKMGRRIRMLTPFFYNLVKNRQAGTTYHFQDIYERWVYFKKLKFSASKRDDEHLKSYLLESAGPFLEHYAKKGGDRYLMMMLDRALWMPGENFLQTDKLYMSQSLEMRNPLSYHPFRAYFDRKLSESDYMDATRNKLFLRNLYASKLPEYVTKRPDKTGWRSPIIDWYDRSFKDLFISIIESVAEKDALVDWQKVRTLIESKDSWPGKHVHGYLSLALLVKKYDIPI